MKIYKTNDGKQIEAYNNHDFVIKLNASSLFGSKATLSEFMKSTAEACKLQNSSEIRYDNIENFVADLVSNNFIEILEK